MSDRLFAPRDQPSIHLPPPDAWKNPEKWLDPDKREKFYAPTDDRGFVLPDATVEMVLNLFRDDYVWEYDPNDPRTSPDEHHFHSHREIYLPKYHNGSTVPSVFRDLAPNKGWMPRQFHNALHYATYHPEVPASFEDMEDFIRDFMIAKQAFTRLIKSAKLATSVQKKFNIRKKDVLLHPERLSGREDDQVNIEYLVSKFNLHFRNYKELLELVQTLPLETLVAGQAEQIKPSLKPQRAIKLLGGKATLQHVNFVPIITGKAA